MKGILVFNIPCDISKTLRGRDYNFSFSSLLHRRRTVLRFFFLSGENLCLCSESPFFLFPVISMLFMRLSFSVLLLNASESLSYWFCWMLSIILDDLFIWSLRLNLRFIVHLFLFCWRIFLSFKKRYSILLIRFLFTDFFMDQIVFFKLNHGKRRRSSHRAIHSKKMVLPASCFFLLYIMLSVLISLKLILFINKLFLLLCVCNSQLSHKQIDHIKGSCFCSA